MKVNGWTLTMASVHGIRVWQNDSGDVQVKGAEGLSEDEFDQWCGWLIDCAGSKSIVPVPENEWLMSDTDLGELIQMDADSFLEGDSTP